jgi:transcriptional regulator with XRE-family HTH domain
MAEQQIQLASSYPAVVGAVLTALRKEKELDQKDLAIACGADAAVSTWSRIEKGESALTVEQLMVAAAVLERMPSEILAIADNQMIELAQRGVDAGFTRGYLAATVAAAAAGAVVPFVGGPLLAAVAAGAAAASVGKSALFKRLQKAVIDKVGGFDVAAGFTDRKKPPK